MTIEIRSCRSGSAAVAAGIELPKVQGASCSVLLRQVASPVENFAGPVPLAQDLLEGVAAFLEIRRVVAEPVQPRLSGVDELRRAVD